MVNKSSQKLIESYLSNRMQFIQIGNKVSTMKPVLTGVPQGSIIGPLVRGIYGLTLKSKKIATKGISTDLICIGCQY